MTIERHEPDYFSDERTMLNRWLEFHRATLAWKCEGLDADQLRRRSVPPSSLSLLGLVRHMGEVEKHWFQRVLAREAAPARFYDDDTNPDGDFDDVDTADVDEAFAYWQDACARPATIEQSFASLDDYRPPPPPRRGRFAPLGARPHGRGVRAPQRPRRPPPGVHRRRDRRLSRGGPADRRGDWVHDSILIESALRMPECDSMTRRTRRDAGTRYGSGAEPAREAPRAALQVGALGGAARRLDPHAQVLGVPGGRPRPRVLGLQHRDRGGDRGDVLRRRRRGHRADQSGELPCLRAGSCSRFVRSIANAFTSILRVSRGSMTSST